MEEKKAAIKEVGGIFTKYDGKVGLRGAYVTQAFQAHTDILFWMYADQFEDMQDLQLELRRSAFGKAITSRDLQLKERQQTILNKYLEICNMAGG